MVIVWLLVSNVGAGQSALSLTQTVSWCCYCEVHIMYKTSCITQQLTAVVNKAVAWLIALFGYLLNVFIVL